LLFNPNVNLTCIVKFDEIIDESDMLVRMNIHKKVIAHYPDDKSILYLAPECILYSKYSSKSDIWATGVILYQLLSKEHPFEDYVHLTPREYAGRLNGFNET
jgi:hypothetical protein